MQPARKMLPAAQSTPEDAAVIVTATTPTWSDTPPHALAPDAALLPSLACSRPPRPSRRGCTA